MESILITGGAGYIGSHTAICLINAGFSISIIDNFRNSKPSNIEAIEKITGSKINFIHGNIQDRSLLSETFKKYHISSVIHFAGLKSVGESVLDPIGYYHTNVLGTLALCQEMALANINKLVFSSSASIYGNPDSMPINENTKSAPISPYGNTKMMSEIILSDLCKSDPRWRIAVLRYFNPGGAHLSGAIGENPPHTPNNLIPYLSRVANGRQKELLIFGDDYNTIDGTGVRDYIHVLDLADGHLAALTYINNNEGIITVNLGTGNGHSVLQMVHAFEKASGNKIPCRIVDRREGDIAACYANVSLAKKIFNWEAKLCIDRICEDEWRWQKKNNV